MLPYLEVTKNEEEETSTQVEMPELVGETVQNAKQILKELGLEYEIDSTDANAVITNQIPKKGIKINQGTKVVLYTN